MKTKQKPKKVNTDLLNLNDLADLPEECLAQLRRGGQSKNIPIFNNVLEIFSTFPDTDLSLNMLVVVYYRMFKETIKRTKMQEAVSSLKGKKLIDGLGNTYYRYVRSK